MNKNATDVIKHNNNIVSMLDEKNENVNVAFEAYIRRIKLNRAYENRNSAQILEELLF